MAQLYMISALKGKGDGLSFLFSHSFKKIATRHELNMLFNSLGLKRINKKVRDLMIKVKKGLDLPISGSPKQEVVETKTTSKVAVIGPDFHGMKPTMKVQVGDIVKMGQELFSDKKNPGVIFTSPVSGKILELNRGARRSFESIVIERSGDDKVTFKSFTGKPAEQLKREGIEALLVESGEWTSFKTRPFSKTPQIGSKPHAIFINGMDTNPLAPKPEVWISVYKNDFERGVNIISTLCDGISFICLKAHHNVNLDIPNPKVKVQTFEGPHPSGNTGTHIHFLSPASSERVIWSINYQDVIAIGRLFKTGELYNSRLISIAGPEASTPKLVQTLRGACISELIQGEVKEGENRAVSGSVFSGRTASGSFDYLGKFHHQVVLLKEDREREFLGWQSIGFNKFSVKPVFFSSLIPGKKFDFTTSTNGSPRAIVPIGSYEKVMPLDILPTYLLRAIMAGDTDMAQKLGALELEEEDLSLCSFVDPGKHDFGPALRKILETIEKDG